MGINAEDLARHVNNVVAPEILGQVSPDKLNEAYADMANVLSHQEKARSGRGGRS